MTKFEVGDIVVPSTHYTDMWTDTDPNKKIMNQFILEIVKAVYNSSYEVKLVSPKTLEAKKLLTNITSGSYIWQHSFLTKLQCTKKQIMHIKNVGDLINI